MKNDEKKIRIYLMPIIAMLITASVLVIIMINRQVLPFGNNSLAKIDCFHQYLPFLNEFRRKLLSGESLFYTWDAFLGSDFVMVFAYLLSSPINIIILFFTSSNLLLFVSVIMLIKIPLSALTMGIYLVSKSEKRASNPLIAAFSVSYALSAYTIGYGWNIMWLDCLIVFPIIILGLDKLIEKGNPFIYIISLAFCIYVNFYFSIMICIYLILRFFTYRYKDIKDFCKKGIQFGLYSILAAGLVSIILCVIAGWFMNSSSVVSEKSPSPYWYTNVFELLRNLYTFSWPVNTSVVDSDVNLYAGVAPVVVMLFLPFCKEIEIREKISRLIMVIILIVSMDNSFLNYIWHGFHSQQRVPNRFSFLLIFLILDTAYMVLSANKKISIKGMIAGAVMAFFMPIVIYFFTDFNGFYSSKAMLIIAIATSLIYSMLFFVNCFDEKLRFITGIILSVLIVFEISINAFKVYGVVYSEQGMIGIEGRFESVNYVKSINADESDFYREEIYDKIIDNENVYQGIHSVGTFSSVQDFNMLYFLGRMGFEHSYPQLIYNGATPFMDDLLGVRYIHSYDPELVKYDYEKIYESAIGDGVYENKDALPIGFGVKDTARQAYIPKETEYAENQNDVAQILSGHTGLYEEIGVSVEAVSNVGDIVVDKGVMYLPDITEEISVDSIFVDGHFTLEEDGKYFIQIRSDRIDSTVIAINDEYYTSEDNKYKLIYLGDRSEGDDIFLELYMSPWQNSEDISVKVYKYNNDVLKSINDELRKNSFEVTDYSGNSIKGSFNLDQGKLLMLTIPYSKGWSIKLDGQKIEGIKVLGYFMGIDAGTGQHTIEMEYHSMGITAGIVVSIISWVVFIILVIRYLKEKSSAVKAQSVNVEETNNGKG